VRQGSRRTGEGGREREKETHSRIAVAVSTLIFENSLMWSMADLNTLMELVSPRLLRLNDESLRVEMDGRMG
jgi:hypothetical protein